MDKKAIKKLLVIVAVFYVAVALCASLMLNIQGSYFESRKGFSFFGKTAGGDASDAALTEPVQEVDPASKLEGMEDLNKTEEGSEDYSQYVEEAEAVVEEDTVNPEDYMSKEAAEALKNTPTTESANEAEEKKEYYSFITNNTDSILRMRVEPDTNAHVVYELMPGTEGYVIEMEDEWSFVYAAGHKGYCSNEFLSMKEISEEEYKKLEEAAKEVEESAGTENTGTKTTTGETTSQNVALAAANTTGTAAAGTTDATGGTTAGTTDATGTAAAGTTDATGTATAGATDAAGTATAGTTEATGAVTTDATGAVATDTTGGAAAGGVQ